jgi:hypothetical protein
MKTIEQIEAEIAALQAEREARKSEPDLSEAVEAFEEVWFDWNCLEERKSMCAAALIAAYPALHKVLGPRSAEPTEAEDLAMARKVVSYAGHRHWGQHDLAIAAFKAERKRAGGA